jgi:uncharacterized ferritin-like protein (DUF455 family)
MPEQTCQAAPLIATQAMNICPPAKPTSIAEAACAVLNSAAPETKVRLTATAATAWRLGRLTHDFDAVPPARPARPRQPIMLSPRQMPKRGKAGGANGRIALLHALAHIELNAIDLAWDILARFGADMPRAFTDDWVKVAREEAGHFALLSRRLKALGSHYGALPAHDGLWESAERTMQDLVGRLAVVPMVLEARGLDVTPQTIERLESAGDHASARILARIYDDEIGHVRIGTQWFLALCDESGTSPEEAFAASIRTYFRGTLKTPFNVSARLSAGFKPSVYLPLAS